MIDKLKGVKLVIKEHYIKNEYMGDDDILKKELKGKLQKELDKISTDYYYNILKALGRANKRNNLIKTMKEVLNDKEKIK